MLYLSIEAKRRIVKPGMHGQMHAWFLEIALVYALVYVSVCVSACLPPRALITSGVIWCDIGRVRLVKQVSQLFPVLITLYDTCHK